MITTHLIPLGVLGVSLFFLYGAIREFSSPFAVAVSRQNKSAAITNYFSKSILPLILLYVFAVTIAYLHFGRISGILPALLVYLCAGIQITMTFFDYLCVSRTLPLNKPVFFFSKLSNLVTIVLSSWYIVAIPFNLRPFIATL